MLAKTKKSLTCITVAPSEIRSFFMRHECFLSAVFHRSLTLKWVVPATLGPDAKRGSFLM